MMRLVLSVVAGAVFLSASTNLVAAELRGAVSSTPVEDDKPKIGLYMNGGDFISQFMIADVLLPSLYINNCYDHFDIEVTHYGMTEEKDGKFYAEKALGGDENIKYLKAMNCIQDLSLKQNATQNDISSSLVLWDAFVSTWDDTKAWLSADVLKAVEECMKSDADKLMHAAGEKTHKDVEFDFKETLDLAVTINGEQIKNIWREKSKTAFCKWSNGAEQCCKDPEARATKSSFLMSAAAPTEAQQAALAKLNKVLAQDTLIKKYE